MILLGLLKETDEERTFSINEETPFWIFLHGTRITIVTFLRVWIVFTVEGRIGRYNTVYLPPDVLIRDKKCCAFTFLPVTISRHVVRHFFFEFLQ